MVANYATEEGETTKTAAKPAPDGDPRGRRALVGVALVAAFALASYSFVPGVAVGSVMKDVSSDLKASITARDSKTGRGRRPNQRSTNRRLETCRGDAAAAT